MVGGENTEAELVKKIADLKLRGVPYDQMGQAYRASHSKIGAEKEFSEYLYTQDILLSSWLR